MHVNLLAAYPGREGRGAAFPIDEAREAAVALSDRLVTHPWGKQFGAVFLAGKRVARAWGLATAQYLVEQPGFPVPTYVVPHPSGINRWWNEPENRAACRALLEQYGAWRPVKES